LVRKKFNKVKIIDCSWHMPQTKEMVLKNIKRTYKNAIFFDLDKNSKKDTDLPHMLTDIKFMGIIVSVIWELKIKTK
jgi:thiosulfate/3-mercaptopyruvate sulfurtransferase